MVENANNRGRIDNRQGGCYDHETTNLLNNQTNNNSRNNNSSDNNSDEQNKHAKLKICSTAIGAILLHLTYGVYQCASNFGPYVCAYLGADPAYTLWIFCVQVVGMVVGMLLAGKFVKPIFTKLGLADKWRSIAGGFLVVAACGLSYLILTITKNFWIFVFVYSPLLGMGCGIGYTAPLLALRAWMPNNAGLAVGMVVCGFGLGGTLFVQIQNMLVIPPGSTWEQMQTQIKTDEDLAARIPLMFLYQALIILAMQCIGVLMLFQKKEDASAAAAGAQGLSVAEAFRTSTLYGLIGFMFLVGVAACYVQAVTKVISPLYNISDSWSSNVNMAASFVNGFSRVLWGVYNDKLGFKTSMITCAVLLIATMGTFGFVMTDGAEFVFLAYWCMLNLITCAIFVLMPSATSHYFGTKYTTDIYAFIFSGYGAAAVLLLFVNKFLIAQGDEGLVDEQAQAHGLYVTKVTFCAIGVISGLSVFMPLLLREPTAWFKTTAEEDIERGSRRSKSRISNCNGRTPVDHRIINNNKKEEEETEPYGSIGGSSVAEAPTRSTTIQTGGSTHERLSLLLHDPDDCFSPSGAKRHSSVFSTSSTLGQGHLRT